MEEDRSFGIILFLNTEKPEKRVLLLQHLAGHFGFPKGHKEGTETDVETALRELKEETGIERVTLLDEPPVFEEYTFIHGNKTLHKIVYYFFAHTDTHTVSVQPEEIQSFTWATYEEALSLATFENTKKLLHEAFDIKYSQNLHMVNL